MSYILGTYLRSVKENFVKGKGCYLYTNKGEKYLDFVQGIAVNALGHNHEHLVKTMKNKADKPWHLSNLFLIQEQEKFAKRLCEFTKFDLVGFQNSGTEATEASIKIARKYFHTIGQPNKKRIITWKGAFHGRPIAALFAANNPKHIEGFDPKVDGFDQVSFADCEALKKAITDKTAAIMVETIMGEGGIKEVSDYCLKALRELCDEKNILLILDEVQCGVGRTGDFFAFEKSGIVPDIVPIAKGIGGGFPLGACLLTKKVSVGMTPGTHGSTLGGNPLAMAVGNGVLDIILQDEFLDNVKKISKYFDQELISLKKKYSKIILEVRGRGLLKGLKLAVDNTKFIETLMKYKMLVVKAEEQVIRLFPALIVSKKEIDEAISKIDQACKEYNN